MIKTNALRIIESANIVFDALEYPTDDGLIDGCSIAAKLGRTPDEVFKTLVTKGASGEYFVFAIPAGGELDLKKAARAVKQKSIEMIPLKQLFPLTGYVHGGCSPVGMKKAFVTCIDESAIIFDRICVSGGRVGLNVSLNPEELAALVGAEFADLVAS